MLSIYGPRSHCYVSWFRLGRGRQNSKFKALIELPQAIAASHMSPSQCLLAQDIVDIKDRGLCKRLAVVGRCASHSSESLWLCPAPSYPIAPQDLYLAGRLLPKKGHFQIDSDGSSSIHEDGVTPGMYWHFLQLATIFGSQMLSESPES